MKIRASITVLSCIAVTFGVTGGWSVAAPADTTEFFEKHVRPVLVNRCYECHSTEKKVKGGLALDTKEATLKGGESGVAVVPGNLEKSRLIEAIRYGNRDLQMPPKSKMPESEVKALEEWVRLGAHDPRTATVAAKSHEPKPIDINEGRKFWSFRPVETPSLPPVKNAAWIKTPVDSFILAKMEEKGLQPAAQADKRTLIRRATFDLTGLPPTPTEIDAFLADNSPDAFQHVVERLLQSPAYGERWGRHWLDVARYADSNGMDENIAYGHAWRYRDYVVRAFNNDKPYDQFLIEQIAGDLLPIEAGAAKVEAITATGFLALGARVLAEPDVRKLEMDIIDEQIDTLGKAFLGMTFGCVRCHDHKFDPVRSDDYYAMAAIFRSTRSLATEKMGAIKFWYEHSLATPEQLEAKKKYEAEVAAKRAEVTAFTNKARNELKAELQAKAADYLAAAALLDADVTFDEVVKLASARGLRPRYLLTCRQYLAKNSEHPVFAKWRELAATQKSDEVRAHYQPLFARAMVAAKDAKAAAPVKEPAAKGAKAKAAVATEAAYKIANPMLAAADAALNDIAGFLAIPDKLEHAFDEATFAKIDAMNDALMKLEEHTPDPAALMGVADGTVSRTLPIHIRGSYLTLGKEIERGFPEVMRVSLAKPVLPAKQSGRLEFSRWLASGEHPLTARVMANRIWRWHFGKGIVASTDNFGILGDKPSHPELLDWLAHYFVEEGWSVKDMHRLIMRSAVYQQSSSIADSNAQPPTVVVNQLGTFPVENSNPKSEIPNPQLVDPENRLLSRFNIQRLEAEQIRDAMLFVSGTLSSEIGGKTIPLRNREFVFNHTSKDHTTYESPRRALYLPIIRNHLYDMLEQFDYPDPTMPTGSRNSTVVAPQALIMLNAPVVMDSGTALAKRLLGEAHGDDAAMFGRMFALLYGRPPTTPETERATRFLTQLTQDEAGNRERALALLCQTYMAANEFMYLR